MWYLPRSLVRNERTVPIIIARGIAHARNGHISTSGLKSDVTIPGPRFHLRHENFDDSGTFKADIGLLNICMGFQDLLAINGVLWGKIGEGWCDIDSLTNSFFFVGGYVCVNFGEKSIKKCNRESARRRTDRQTDRLTH